MIKLGDVVKLNSRVPNDSLHGYVAIITRININNIPGVPESSYAYEVRFLGGSLEHVGGSVRANWVDEI